MFGELLESRRRRVRQRSGTAVSMVAHCTLVGLAMMATKRGAEAMQEGERREIVIPLPIERTAEPGAPRPVTRTTTHSPDIPLPRPIVLPDLVPTDLPAKDLLDTGPTEMVWTTSAPPGPIVRGEAGSMGGGGRDGVPFAISVEKPAVGLPGNPAPRYPDVLRNAAIEGKVRVQVVVDTAGRADLTRFMVVESTHPMFDASVLASLPKFRFLPAETGGRKVAMWVEMTFLFEMKR